MKEHISKEHEINENGVGPIFSKILIIYFIVKYTIKTKRLIKKMHL